MIGTEGRRARCGLAFGPQITKLKAAFSKDGMTMRTIQGFLDMGGYAAFVWPALLITLVVLAGLLLASWRRQRAEERTLHQLEGRLPGGRRAGKARSSSDEEDS